jgi:hypothetical protein
MKLKNPAAVLAVTLCGLLVGATLVASAGPAAGAVVTSAPSCAAAWGSLDKSAGALSAAPLLTSRVGRHDCFDRLVFELNGPATGYRVSYGEAYTQGQGAPMSPYTAGGALLQVVLLDPTYDVGTGISTYPAATGDHVANVLGFQTLRDVVFGGSFEGHTTFAVGVRARLPFTVFVLPGPGAHSRIVLDVAHTW